MTSQSLLIRSLPFISLGATDAPSSLADLLAQARAAVTAHKAPVPQLSGAEHAPEAPPPPQAQAAQLALSLRSVDELVRLHLLHRVPAVQLQGAVELETRLRAGTQADAVRLCAQLRSLNAFRAAVGLLRAPALDADQAITLLAVVKFLLAAANVDAATRERLRYVGAVPALLARCAGASISSADSSSSSSTSSAMASMASGNAEDDTGKLTLACLRALLALAVDSGARSALRRIDGLARLIRLISADDAKPPLQLVATAVLALATSDAGAADELSADAVADVIVMLLRRAGDDRIVAQALRLLLNASRAASLCQRIASAEDGRARRAIVHAFDKFLSSDELFAATTAATVGGGGGGGGGEKARALAQQREQQTTLLAMLAGFARNELLCRALSSVVPRVAQFLRAPAGSAASFVWDANLLGAALGAVQMLCVSDSSRALLLDDGHTRAALVAIVDTPSLYSSVTAAAASSCLQALWQMQPDEKLDPKEARAVVSLLRRSERYVDAARTAVQTLTAMAGGGEAVLVPLLALGGLELLHGIAVDTIAVGDADSALASFDIRTEAARALRRLARISSARVAMAALAPVSVLATLPLDVDGSADAARFAAVALQLLAQLVRDGATARAFLTDAAALGALIARVTCKHAQLRRAALAALAALARHSLAEMTRWGVIDHLIEFVGLDDAATPERQVAMQLLAAVAATSEGEALLVADERLPRLRLLSTAHKSQATVVGKMARNILSAVSLRSTLAASQSTNASASTRTAPYLRCEASDGRVAALDVPATSELATKDWLAGELCALFRLAAPAPITFLPDDGASRALVTDADVRLCVSAAAAAPSRSVRVLVQTTVFDSGIERDTVKRILDKLSRDDLIQLLGATAQLGHVLIKDALVAWRSGSHAASPAAAASAPAAATPASATSKAPPPPPPSGGPAATLVKRKVPPPPPPPSQSQADAAVVSSRHTSSSSDSGSGSEDEASAAALPVDPAAAELVAVFDAAAVRFQELSMAMHLEEAHAAGEAMLEAAALPTDESQAMELEALQYALADATNYVLECAQLVLEDPDDEDAVERFTASYPGLQEAIVGVRQVLAPWDYADKQRTDGLFPGQFRVTAADIRKVKLRDQSLRMTDDAAAVAADDGDTANMKLLNELRVAVTGGMRLRKVERLTASEREATRQLSASELMLRDLTANVQALRSGGLERRVLLDQDTQLGYRYFTEPARWIEALAPLLCEAARGAAFARLLLTLCEMRDSEMPWAEAVLSFDDDERWLSNALRVVGFSLKRRIYARRFADTAGSASDDDRIVEYEAVVRQPSLPLGMLVRCILVAVGGLEALPVDSRPPPSPQVLARGAKPTVAHQTPQASPHQSPQASPTPPRRPSSSLQPQSPPSSEQASSPAMSGWAAGAITKRPSTDHRASPASPLLVRATTAAGHTPSSPSFVRATSNTSTAPRALLSLGRHRSDSNEAASTALPRPPLPTPPTDGDDVDDDEPPPVPTTRAPTLPPSKPLKASAAALLDEYDE